MSKLTETKKILSDLKQKTTDIVGSAVVRKNGLTIASDFPTESNDRMVSAMSAALLGTSKRCSEALFEQSEFKGLDLELDKGHMLIMGAGSVILVVITGVSPNIGFITLEMETSIDKIQKTYGLS